MPIRPLILMLALSVALGEPAATQAAASSLPKNDYRDAKNWLCRPDRSPDQMDACQVDLSTTVVSANGKVAIEKFIAHPAAPIDCFYVYPTVSLDPTPLSDMQPGPEELNVVRQQFARFGSQCRLFAPLYRQISLTALQAMLAGTSVQVDSELGYSDVLNAWHDYLQHDNQGRGVVLIGHSQGAKVLMQLIANEIDGKPIQERLVSAHLLGWNVPVPKGYDIGGAFQSIPLCRTEIQSGCVVSYASFHADSPPPANSRFGRLSDTALQSACTNPAALKGGRAELHAYFANAAANSLLAPKSWTNTGAAATTPFIGVPGLLSAECVVKDGASYLEIAVHDNAYDARVGGVAGNVVRNGVAPKEWGLHLIDINLAMGNLVHLVGEQAKGYLKICDCKNNSP